MDRLYDKLMEYSKSEDYPMHMPGHKRNTELCKPMNPYSFDITEIKGFDNLHQPEEILLNLSERISRLYGANCSYPLVNGSTAGILAGISAAVHPGDKVLVARNCHKSVYHGVILLDLKPVYCYPQNIEQFALHGGILPEEIEESLITHSDIKLVVITSPTYEGVVSDISEIAKVAHKYGAYLLVDEAHGAHFGFHKGFPQSAVRLGADLIIQSLHKTLPSLTQTAVLHCNAGELNARIRKYLAIYQSSSPSYVLMAGIDQCIQLLEERAEDLFERYHNRLMKFYQEMGELKYLRLLCKDRIGQDGIYDLDPSKLTISVRGTGMNGHELHQLLQQDYHIMLEMDAVDYVLAMTSIGDTEEGFERLKEALRSIDQKIEDRIVAKAGQITDAELAQMAQRKKEPHRIMPPRIDRWPSEAWDEPVKSVDFEDSTGEVSAAFLSLFPPGAPLLIPGEVISQELIDYILQAKEQGITVTGLTGEAMNKIEVIA